MISRNLLARIAVAVVAIPVILWISYEGGTWLRGLTLVLAAIAAWEILTRSGFPVSTGWFWLGWSGAMLLVVIGTAPVASSQLRVEPDVLAGAVVILFFLLSSMLAAIGKRPPSELYARQTKYLWSVLYIGLLYPFVYKVGTEFDFASGGDILLFLLALIWIGDTAAMGVGKAIGKHKLAPSVSPNKTVEGFIGHVAFCIVMAVGFHFWKLPQLSIAELATAATGISMFGQLGDLVESMWKRSVGVKDSSSIIPGHGGVLDRFDSLLFGAPFLYAYLSLLVK